MKPHPLHRFTRLSLVLIVAVLSAHMPAAAQTASAQQVVSETRRLFDAGRDQEVIRAAASAPAQGDAQAQLQFLAAQSYTRLKQTAQARQVYAQLAARPQSDPWSFIGQSAVAIADRRFDTAVTAAARATTMSPNLAQGFFQLGMAQGYKQDFARAAEAFTRATTIDPNFAYAHYNAGLSYQKVRRTDLMARHFEAFLRLAPQAPERPMVESIMRSIRK